MSFTRQTKEEEEELEVLFKLFPSLFVANSSRNKLFLTQIEFTSLKSKLLSHSKQNSLIPLLNEHPGIF